MKATQIIKLPFPISVNELYDLAVRTRFDKKKKKFKHYAYTYMTTEGKNYKRDVINLCRFHKMLNYGRQRLDVEVRVYPKDRKIRDLANLDKILMDSLEAAGVFHNDSQIDDYRFRRGEIRKPGEVEVIINVLSDKKRLYPEGMF